MLENSPLLNKRDFFIPSKPPSPEALHALHDAWMASFDTGESLGSFKKRFDKVMLDFGWKFQDQPSDVVRTVFAINNRVMRMHQLWQQFQKNKDIAPYLRYSSVLDSRSHQYSRLLDGVILPIDNPFWLTHFPPNAIDCIDTVVALSNTGLKRANLNVTTNLNEEQFNSVNPPWNYNVGVRNMFVYARCIAIDQHLGA